MSHITHKDEAANQGHIVPFPFKSVSSQQSLNVSWDPGILGVLFFFFYNSIVRFYNTTV